MDEAESLEAIFSEEEEFEWISKTPIPVFRLNLKADTHIKSSEFSLTIELGETYPDMNPSISISSKDLDRKSSDKLLTDIFAFSRNLTGTPMIFEIVTWTRENFANYLGSQQTIIGNDCRSDKKTEENYFISLYTLDHIRDRKKYAKSLKQMTKSTSVSGVLMILARSVSTSKAKIVLLVEGNQENLKDYEKLHRTQNVDVDSYGRPCKERLLKKLCADLRPQKERRFTSEFEVVEMNRVDDMKEKFDKYNLIEIYEKYVEGSYDSR